MLKRFLLILTLLLTTVSSYPIIQSDKDFEAALEKGAITFNILDKHFKKKDNMKATKACAKDLEIIVDDVIVYAKSKEENMNDDLEAKAVYSKVLSYFYDLKIFCCWLLGKNDEGLMNCGKALRLDKDDAEAYYVKALIWMDLGDQIKGDRNMKIAAEKGCPLAKEYILGYS